LSDAELAVTKLVGCNLSWSTLESADFTSAEIVDVDFSFSSMQNIDFENAMVVGSCFRRSDVTRAKFYLWCVFRSIPNGDSGGSRTAIPAEPER